MYEINQIGYFPAYGLDNRYKFTKKFSKKISVTMDAIVRDNNADINILMQCEPPNLYVDFFGMVQHHYEKFDLVLAYDERILNIPGINAIEFCPVGSWISEDIVLNKANQISYLMSSKINGYDYHMRFMIMRWLQNNTLKDFEIKWHRSPPRVPNKDEFFSSAMFNIACENQVMNNMFTEKLLDCFKTKTIPIYYGCKNIEKYFNPKGIIQFNTIEQFAEIVKNLTPSLYYEMLPYAEENYERSREYWSNTVYQRVEELVHEQFFEIDQTNEFLLTHILD